MANSIFKTRTLPVKIWVLKSTKKKTNVKLAANLKKKNNLTPLRILDLVGKPVYFILLGFFIGLLYLVSLIGLSVRVSTTHVLAAAGEELKSMKLFAGNSLSNTTKLLKKKKLPAKKKNSRQRTKRQLKSRPLVLKSLFTTFLHPQRLNKKRAGKKSGTNFAFPAFSWPRPLLSIPKVRVPSISHLPGLPKLRRREKIAITFFAAFLIPAGIFWYTVLKDLPSPTALITRDIEVSTKIYDRNGVLLYKIYKDQNRTLTSLSDIPEQVRLATLAAEDAEFYSHKGFSIRGISRSFFKNLEKGELSGGSTITQQLVKNALLTPEKTLTRKLKEVALAVRVEFTYSKDQILEMYLNEVPYGGTAYGIQEASEAYFGKSVKDLDLAQAAYLAGLPKSPSLYSPFSGELEAGLHRQKDVLNLMKINGFISEEEEQKAAAEKLVFAENRTDIKAPHFVMYVRQKLAEKYGEEVVETGGLEVVTTLDYSVQALAEEVVKNEIDSLKRFRVGNGAVVVLDPKTNEILAMVGSKDYFDTENDGNVNVTLRPRSPGSSIKVVNYAYALSTKFTPATIIDDAPVSYSVPGQPVYTPKNYDGRFHGKVTLRQALAQSLNIPAVKVLKENGIGNMIDLGEKMGITTWGDRSRFGLSLTLGGGEVRLLDLATVYSTLASYGEKKDTWSIKKVTNYKGKVLDEEKCGKSIVDEYGMTVSAAEGTSSTCPGTPVLDPRVAYSLIDILKDNDARAPAFGRYSQLVIPSHPEVAVKTGTSNDLRDNLTVGFTQDYLVAVWVGNNDNSPMSGVASGLTGASTIFNKVMKGVLSEKESLAWKVPSGLVKLPICAYTGTLACNGCPTKYEWFLDEKKPSYACRPEQILALEQNKRLQEGQILDNAASTQATEF